MTRYEIVVKEFGTYTNHVAYLFDADTEQEAVEAWENGEDPIDVIYLEEDLHLPDDTVLDHVAEY